MKHHYAISLVFQMKEGAAIHTFNCLYSTWANSKEEAFSIALDMAKERNRAILTGYDLTYHQELQLPCTIGDNANVDAVQEWPESLDV